MKKIFLFTAISLFCTGILNGQNWSLTGNAAGTTDFLGTTNSNPLVFKVNNQAAGFITSNSLLPNTGFGYQTLRSNAGGKYNSAFGYYALQANLTGSHNTAIGHYALYANQSGSSNTATGSYALYSNTTGYSNTATGYRALYLNKDGYYNNAGGYYSLYSNTSGDANTAFGYRSGYANTTGNDNTFIGSFSGYSSTTGTSNTFVGWYSGYNNNAGYSNTYVGNTAAWQNNGGHDNAVFGYNASYANAVTNYNSIFGSLAGQNITSSINSIFGYGAAIATTTGYDNTVFGAYAATKNISGYSNAIFGKTAGYNSLGNNNAFFGNYAGLSNTTGSNNTYLGYLADGSSPSLTNATAIGYGAKATASNQVMLGNSALTSVRTFSGIIWTSDGRFKKNIKENVPGLDFIKQLRPVTYSYDIHKLNDFINPSKNNTAEAGSTAIDKTAEESIVQKEKKIYSGFIAQEVEKIADKMGYDFSGVYKPQNDKDPYGLSYAEFVVPLVKAVQELSNRNDEKDAAILDLQNQINELKRIIPLNIQPQKTDASLEQNAPNPFSSSAIIRYHLPSSISAGQIVITNSAGYTVKTYLLNSKGGGTITIRAGELAAGNYHYTLYVNGKKADSKQMMLIK